MILYIPLTFYTFSEAKMIRIQSKRSSSKEHQTTTFRVGQALKPISLIYT